MNVIEVEDLTKYYGDFRALDSISFSVPEGIILGVIGPNGAGKLPSSEFWAVCSSTTREPSGSSEGK